MLDEDGVEVSFGTLLVEVDGTLFAALVCVTVVSSVEGVTVLSGVLTAGLKKTIR